MAPSSLKDQSKDDDYMSLLSDGGGGSSTQLHKVVGTVLTPSVAEGAASCPFLASDKQQAPNEENEEVSVINLFSYVKSNGSLLAVQRMVAKLEEEGHKDACAASDEGGHTLSHWAAKRGEASMLEFLITKGAPVKAPSSDLVGMQPLHWAATEGRLSCMRLLVDSGSDVDAKDLQGCTPLLIAAQWGQADAAAYLVKVGANPNIFDKNDDSSLHWASYKGNLEIVGLLVHLGLAIDQTDVYGHTPLHLAALRGNLSTCEYLLVDAAKSAKETSSRLKAADIEGRTPRDLAMEKRHGRVARFLGELRPACEQGYLTFIREKLTLGACIGWVQGGTNPEAMRWPWFIMVMNKVVAQAMYFSYFLATYREEVDAMMGSEQQLATNVTPPPTPLVADDVPLLAHAMILNTQILVWIVFVLCWRGDPGVVDSSTNNGGLTRAYEAYFDRLVTGEELKPNPDAPAPPRTLTLCHTCHIVRPLRAKHCKVKRKCVMCFDHYCPYVGNTVGLYNYKWFFLYCLLFTVSAVQWQALAVMYHRRQGHVDKLLAAAQCWFLLFIFFGLAMVTYHTQLSCSNLSTNEQMNMHRYDYFRDVESGAMTNPFDKGVANNVIERAFPAPLETHPLILQITAHLDGTTTTTRRKKRLTP